VAVLTISLRNTDNSALTDHTRSIPREDKHLKPSDHASGKGTANENESSWMSAAYPSTKVVIDVVKESSDVFPPLKSVASGLAALLKHYNV